jgi:hypothetical protein
VTREVLACNRPINRQAIQAAKKRHKSRCFFAAPPSPADFEDFCIFLGKMDGHLAILGHVREVPSLDLVIRTSSDGFWLGTPNSRNWRVAIGMVQSIGHTHLRPSGIYLARGGPGSYNADGRNGRSTTIGAKGNRRHNGGSADVPQGSWVVPTIGGSLTDDASTKKRERGQGRCGCRRHESRRAGKGASRPSDACGSTERRICCTMRIFAAAPAISCIHVSI